MSPEKKKHQTPVHSDSTSGFETEAKAEEASDFEK
jgi:hypothetical protein